MNEIVELDKEALLKLYPGYHTVFGPYLRNDGRKQVNLIGNNKRKEHLITVLLKDKNYPNMKIEGGKIILWQDIQSQ